MTENCIQSDDSEIRYKYSQPEFESNFSMTISELPGFQSEYAPNKKHERFIIALFIFFWIFWIIIFCGSIWLTSIPQNCNNGKHLQNTTIYEINIRYFMDNSINNTDSGTNPSGNIKGIQTKLPELLNGLSIKAIQLSPLSATENGIVENFTSINSEFGTLSDFKNLLTDAKKLNISVILRFIINHTGRNHLWFTKSLKREEKYKDFYIWKDKNSISSTWINRKGYPAWNLEPTRGQYYYASHSHDLPDLNLRNKDVISELKTVLSFWLKLGVDGFCIENSAFLIEKEDTLFVQPLINSIQKLKKIESSESQFRTWYERNHTGQLFQPETSTVFTALRAHLDEWFAISGNGSVLIADSGDTGELLPRSVLTEWVGTEESPGAHFVRSYQLLPHTGNMMPSSTESLSSVLNRTIRGQTYSDENTVYPSMTSWMTPKFQTIWRSILPLVMKRTAPLYLYNGQENIATRSGFSSQTKTSLFWRDEESDQFVMPWWSTHQYPGNASKLVSSPKLRLLLNSLIELNLVTTGMIITPPPPAISTNIFLLQLRSSTADVFDHVLILTSDQTANATINAGNLSIQCTRSHQLVSEYPGGIPVTNDKNLFLKTDFRGEAAALFSCD